MIRTVARIVLFAQVALLVGCSATPEQPPPPDAISHEVAPAPRELIYLEVTPAAAREVRAAVDGMKLEQWWLRYEMVPGGCTGCQNKLWIETNPPTDLDFVHTADGVPCVLLKSQRHLAQGARIDFGQKDGQTGFLVTNPHASEQTKEVVSKWIMEEFKKRNPDVVPDPESK